MWADGTVWFPKPCVHRRKFVATALQARDNPSMPSATITFTPQQAEFIRQSIAEGRFQDESEAVRAGLQLLKQQEEEYQSKLETLRRMAKEGFDQIDRGEYRLITPDTLGDFIDAVRATPASKQ